MMRVATVGLIICRMIASVHASKETDILKASESRYHSSPDYQHRDHPNYNKRKDFDHPVNFNVPHFIDHWRPHQNDYNRRTFFSDFPYSHHGTTTPFPSFYQFMTSLFGGGDEPREKFLYNRNRPTPPYPLENSYSFRPTEPNYIPPPKPIRASVIKLESITRSPIYSSFEVETTTKYYHNVGSLLNHVLIENSKSQQQSGFHPREPIDEAKIPPFKPLPVLPKPRYTSPTVPSKRLPFHRYNETDYKYPDSVQDQLPHLQLGDIKIPYESEKSNPQIFDTLPTEISSGGRFGYTRSPDIGATTNILGLIDIRAFNFSGVNSERQEKRPGEERFEFYTTTIKSFPGAVEKIKRPTIKFTKKVSTHPDKSSVERVTNLTVQGLSKIGQENISTHNAINYLKVKNLITYEMGRLQNSSEPSRVDNSSKRLVNLNDELSLDAKILKDTNWDGLTSSETSVTVEVLEASTTTAKPKQNKIAFWEIMETESTSIPTTEITRPTTITTERVRPETTTELWFVTRDNTETNEPSTTTEETTTPRILKVAERRVNVELPKAALQEVEPSDESILKEGPPRRRKYNRRPKIVNFTPYPTTEEELQKRLTNRNHFAKRQKPNITLSFGNKNVLKRDHNFGKDEVMRFSDEDVKKRKIGKRRQLYKRVRVSTSEHSTREDLQK